MIYTVHQAKTQMSKLIAVEDLTLISKSPSSTASGCSGSARPVYSAACRAAAPILGSSAPEA